jgi:hypothetical protein
VKELALVAAAAVILIACWALWRIGRREPTSPPRGRWTAAHHSLPHGGVEVRLECPGEEPIHFDTVRAADPDFDDRLHTAMAEARSRAAALNSERTGG